MEMLMISLMIVFIIEMYILAEHTEPILDYSTKMNFIGKILLIIIFIMPIIIVTIIATVIFISILIIMIILVILNGFYNLLLIKKDNWYWIWEGIN